MQTKLNDFSRVTLALLIAIIASGSLVATAVSAQPFSLASQVVGHSLAA
jgi:hypothetical protein